MVLSPRQGCMLSLALLLALLAVNACGTNVAAPAHTLQTSGRIQPERVQIQVGMASLDTHGRPVLTLTRMPLVARLYALVLTLPEMPHEQMCTDELGTSYTLVFWRGGQRLTALTAQRFGCQVVALEGVQQKRRATPDFWSLVDQALYAATPVGAPDWLALMYVPGEGQRPLSARLISGETTRGLYSAILQLPLASSPGSCAGTDLSAYTLLFHQADMAIPAVLSQRCNTLSLQGDYRTRGGTFLLTNAFKDLFTQALVGAAFAPARPDQLAVSIETGNGTASSQQVTDTDLSHTLYTRAFALPRAPLALPQTCNDQDKVSGKGRWYTFEFRQWGLTLLRMELYEGSCRLITLEPSGTLVSGDASFWNLVHQAAHI